MTVYAMATETKRRGKGDQSESNGWAPTIECDDAPAEDSEVNDTPELPWPREYSLTLGQLVISLIILLVGDVLFAGYTLGIFEGLICWSIGLLGLGMATSVHARVQKVDSDPNTKCR